MTHNSLYNSRFYQDISAQHVAESSYRETGTEDLINKVLEKADYSN